MPWVGSLARPSARMVRDVTDPANSRLRLQILPPMMVHYLVHNYRRYLAYCLLSVRSLIERGAVPPKRIVVSASACLFGSPEMKALQNMGVKTRSITNGYTQKLIALEEVFFEYRASRIVQLDADTVLLEKCSFFDLIEVLCGGHAVCAYSGSKDGVGEFENRKHLFLPSFNPNHPEGMRRLDALMKGVGCGGWFQFQDHITKWVLGGMTIWNGEIIGTPAWRALQALAWVTKCDETPLQMVRWMAKELGLDFATLERLGFPHNVSPQKLSFGEGVGMVHYAGDWYREHMPQYREVIEAELSVWFNLPLPTDGPKGPAREPHFARTRAPGGDSSRLEELDRALSYPLP